MDKKGVIDTTKFNRSGKVEVDGMLWDVILPGSGVDMKISKAQRRLKLLDKKIEDGSATEEDYDKYDELEDYCMSTIVNMFRDSTPDNAEVKKWVEETPSTIIYLAIKDIKEQAND